MILLPLQVPRHDPRVHGWHRGDNLREAEGPRSHSFSQRERTGTALHPKVALPALFPRGPAPYAQMVMFARLTHSAALPSLPLPLLARSPTFLFTSSQGAAALPLARARHRTPSLPRSLRVIGDGVRHCGVCVGVGGGLRPLSVRPSGRWREGWRAHLAHACLPSAGASSSVSSSLVFEVGGVAEMDTRIPQMHRPTDRPTELNISWLFRHPPQPTAVGFAPPPRPMTFMISRTTLIRRSQYPCNLPIPHHTNRSPRRLTLAGDRRRFPL